MSFKRGMSLDFTRNISYTDLRNNDIENLVEILRDHPADSSGPGVVLYFNDIKQKINAMPSHLHS